jgi:hypothetical protein
MPWTRGYSPYESPAAPRPEIILTVVISAVLVEWLRYKIGEHKYTWIQVSCAFAANFGIHLWHRPDSVLKAFVASALGEASMAGLIALIGIFFWKIWSVIGEAGFELLKHALA